MGSTQLTSHSLESFEQSRKQVLATTHLTPEHLREANDEQLLQLQAQLLMGNTWGKWEVAKELMTAGMQKESTRTFRLGLAIPESMDGESDAARRVWRELMRFAIAMRLWPGPKGRLQKFSSIKGVITGLGRITRQIAALDEGGFWSRTNRIQAKKILGRVGQAYLNTVEYYHRLGALPDGPISTKRKGRQPHHDRTGEPEHSTHPDEMKQWQPFPDAYTAAAGWRAVQMIRIVGPTLLAALEKAAETPIRTVTTEGKLLSKDRLWQLKKQALDPIITDWDWRSPDGLPLDTLPMTINIRTKGNRGGVISWPPSTHTGAWRMLSLLQACHLWLIALPLAARQGEVLSMCEGSLRRETSETPTGSFITWKLDGPAGREGEAPLPDVVIFALRQQERLAKLVKRVHGVESNHLWVQTGDRRASEGGHRLNSFWNALWVFNSAFELEQLLDGTVLHMHRFRKTLVRIVALALVHAPKILMDILGHRDEQMTVMRYILSDPSLLSEIEEVTREMVVLKGLEAVSKRGQLQGKAAPAFRERVAMYCQLLGCDALEPQNLREFVHTITEGGGGWAIIGPGKVCTGFTKGGACNQGTGKANPHYCTPTCHNQLLMPDYDEPDGSMASAIVDAVEALDYMIDQLRQADDNGEVMLIAQFSGQVKGLLNQWREVDLHFKNHHGADPLVRKYIANALLLS